MFEVGYSPRFFDEKRIFKPHHTLTHSPSREPSITTQLYKKRKRKTSTKERKMYFLSLLLLPLLTRSKIIEMTADNFDDVVEKNDFTFVIFHADPSISWHYFKDVERHLVSLDSLVTKRAEKNYGLVLATANVKKETKLSVYSGKQTLHAMVFSNDPVNFPPITYKGSFVAMHMYVYSLLIQADNMNENTRIIQTGTILSTRC